MARPLPLAAALLALAFAAPAHADTTFTVTKTADVNDGGCLPGNCSLRDAVNAANVTAGTDTISLPPGQFKLEGAAGEDANAGGDLDVTESLNVVGSGSGATTIDANHIDRAFDIRTSTATLGLTNLALTGGVDGNAGVILTPGPALTLTGVLFKDNAAGGGGTSGFGLIHATASGAFALTVDHTTFDSNTSGGGGGAGFGLMDIITGPNSTVKFIDSTFTSNHVGGGTNGSGFGLIDFNAGAGAAMTVTRTVMGNNTVGGGMNASGFGLIDQLSGSLDVVDSTISDNQVGGGASGASGFGTIVFPSSGPFTMSGSTFSGNQVGGGGATSSGFGGAIDANGSGPVTIENSTFVGNTAGGGASDATGFGGALDLGSGTITLTNLTFVGNVAGGDSGTGGAVYPSTPAGVTSKNNVFSGNTAAGVPNSCGSAIGTSGGGNIDDTPSCGFTAPADLVGNPLLGSLGAFGGLTPTVPLLPGSPAIDRGAGCSATDQRGQPRTGASCDSGAYEFAPPVPTTGAASAIKMKGATLGGSLIPSLRAASFHFEYGKTTSYGAQTPAQTAGGTLSAVGASAPISGLSPGSTYHYRLVAAGDATVAGKDATFTTARVSLSKLRMSPARFRAAPKGGSISRKRKTGTNITYTVSSSSKTTFRVLKPAAGRRVGKSCRKQSPRNRRGRKCTRYVSVGKFSHTDKAGKNKLHFTGRVHRHKLAPGKYRLRATPRASGVNGKPRTARFKIVP